MANFQDRTEREGHEPSGNNTAARRAMPAVNFEEMNFEQRRAPYNSGERLISTEHSKKPDPKNSGAPQKDH